MAKRYLIFTIILFLLKTSLAFSQTKQQDMYVYELTPITSVKLKVYHTRDKELKKIQMPQNYMVVKRPQEEKIYIWEFPAVIPKDEAPQKQDKELKEKESAPKETKPPGTSGNLLELSKQLGIGEIKEGTTADALKSLLNKELK